MTQKFEVQTIINPSMAIPTLTQEVKECVELTQKIMREQKTILPSQKNQHWKDVEEETEKVNELLKYIITDNINEVNVLINEVTKQVAD